MTSRANSSIERRTRACGSPPKFIQHSTSPTPRRRSWSIRSATVSGEPNATVSATSCSQVIFASRSSIARNPGCSSGWSSSIRSGIRNRRRASWYQSSASRASSSASASVGAT